MATGRPNSSAKATTSSGPVDRVGGAGHEGGLGREGDVPRLDLVAEAVDGLGAGADPDQPGVDDLLGEAAVLGEEAVARVHRVGTGLVRDLDQLVLQQVGVAGRGAAEGVGLVGDLDVERVAVRLGVDGDGSDAVVRAGAGDADRDLTPVGDEDFADGHVSDSIGTRSPLTRGGRAGCEHRCDAVDGRLRHTPSEVASRPSRSARAVRSSGSRPASSRASLATCSSIAASMTRRPCAGEDDRFASGGRRRSAAARRARGPRAGRPAW